EAPGKVADNCHVGDARGRDSTRCPAGQRFPVETLGHVLVAGTRGTVTVIGERLQLREVDRIPPELEDYPTSVRKKDALCTGPSSHEVQPRAVINECILQAIGRNGLSWDR